MKLVIQRVKSASVSIDGQVYNAIQQGLLLLVGVGPEDDQKDLDYAVRKVSQMRIFSDEEDAFNDQLEKEVPVKRGIFGADMAIELINDGPVTILLDTKNP